MTTKQKILKEALNLFAEKGYNAVYVGEIAEAVGIKAPSLYKHYKSKQDIFNAILEEMKKSYDEQALTLNMSGSNAETDANIFSAISEDKLVQIGVNLFSYFLHDDYASKFRKMLTVEQFRNPDLSLLYQRQYVDDPLSYQAAMFSLLSANSFLIMENADIMALHFYSPIYMLLTVCDRQPERENEILHLIEQHIRQFNRLYCKEKSK
ncbi:MAG: TetR/AcrR family transcriptional regulator [Oscillospiraceae bacterium]|nr:TetR/AcrR family transcriptional regulator [Oscillospiraceae bacterium]